MTSMIPQKLLLCGVDRRLSGSENYPVLLRCVPSEISCATNCGTSEECLMERTLPVRYDARSAYRSDF